MDLTSLATALGAGALLTKIVDRFLTRPDRERDVAKALRDELRGEMTGMRERIAVLEARVSELTAERDQHRANVLVREAERDIARTQLEQVTAERDALHAEVDRLRSEVAELRGEIGELEDERDDATG